MTVRTRVSARVTRRLVLRCYILSGMRFAGTTDNGAGPWRHAYGFTLCRADRPVGYID